MGLATLSALKGGRGLSPFGTVSSLTRLFARRAAPRPHPEEVVLTTVSKDEERSVSKGGPRSSRRGGNNCAIAQPKRPDAILFGRIRRASQWLAKTIAVLHPIQGGGRVTGQRARRAL